MSGRFVPVRRTKNRQRARCRDVHGKMGKTPVQAPVTAPAGGADTATIPVFFHGSFSRSLSFFCKQPRLESKNPAVRWCIRPDGTRFRQRGVPIAFGKKEAKFPADETPLNFWKKYGGNTGIPSKVGHWVLWSAAKKGRFSHPVSAHGETPGGFDRFPRK
jgi:hypothetical protein